MSQKFSTRQLRQHTVLPMLGNSVDESGDSVLSKIDSQLGKLFEDRNMLLTGGGTASLNTSGTSLAFTANFVLYINQNVAGAAPYAISLSTSNSPISFTADGKMAYLVINRTAQTATFTADASSLPAAIAANQEIVMIAKRVGTSVFLKGGFCIPAGGSVVLGRVGSVVDTEFLINDSSDPTKQIAFDAGGATGTKTTLIAAQTANRSLTLPDITDTLVSRTNTETLSNKQVQFSTSTDSTTTGSNSTSQAFTSGVIRLTNSSLVSLSGIPAGSSGQFVVIENKTGNQISINNEESTASASNRIQTGTNSNISMPNNSTFMFTYDSTSSRWQLSGGSGSGSGGGGSKNYLSAVTTSQSTTPNTGNGNFESGSTTGWSLGTIGTLTNGLPTGSPTFGSGSSGNLSLGIVSSGQLAGSYSASYSSSTATTQGNMLASDAFYIDKEDQAKVLTFKMYYSVPTNPSNGNFSGTSSNSFGLAVYDVTNSSWIPVTSAFGMTQNSGVGIVSGTFQTATNTAQLRFCLYNVNATSGAITLYLDDIFVGPQTISLGAPVSDWILSGSTIISATTTAPTKGTATIVADNMYYRRVGGDMEIRMEYKTSAPGTATSGSGDYLFQIPNGFSIDTTKVTPYSSVVGVGALYSASNIVGVASTNNSGGSGPGTVSVYDTSHVRILYQNQNASFTGGSLGAVGSGYGNLAASGTTSLVLEFKVPILGWSSTTQMSNDTDTRVVAATYAVSTTASITLNTVINFDVKLIDTHAAVTTGFGVWKFVAPVSGIYGFSGNFQSNTGGPNIKIWKNGSVQYYLCSTTTSAITPFTGQIALNAGDYIDFRPDSTQNIVGGSAGAYLTLVNIERISGPSVIAASEAVNASYNDVSGGSIGTSAAVYKFQTKLYDSHAAYSTSTGLYTVPVSGKYLVSIVLNTSTITLSTSQFFVAYIYKNGSQYVGAPVFGNGASHSNTSVVCGTVDCLPGDTLAAFALSNIATTAALGGNLISIQRVGN